MHGPWTLQSTFLPVGVPGRTPHRHILGPHSFFHNFFTFFRKCSTQRRIDAMTCRRNNASSSRRSRFVDVLVFISLTIKLTNLIAIPCTFMRAVRVTVLQNRFRTFSDLFESFSDRFCSVSGGFDIVFRQLPCSEKTSNFNWPGLGPVAGRPPSRPKYLWDKVSRLNN